MSESLAASDATMAGPVLVLAANQAIATNGPAWAQAFAASRLLHRVRLVSEDGDRDLAAVVAEARSLRAASILAVGEGAQLAVGRAAAKQLELPLLRADG